MKYFILAVFGALSVFIPAATAADPPPVPNPQQLAWQRHEFIAFAHFGMNTFTDREWGDGKEDPKLFNPTDFDARQWAGVLDDAGVRLLILTAKHHDGFCLWPSELTGHSVRNSPWREGKGDVVREVVEALRERRMRVGLYLSPWDRNQPAYGDSPRYNEYFRRQLRELLTQSSCAVSPRSPPGACAWSSVNAGVVLRRAPPGSGAGGLPQVHIESSTCESRCD
jgi:alpha-L-fucosidase